MVIRPLTVLLAVPLLALPVACAAPERPRRPAADGEPARAAAPRTATEFLDLAEGAMRQEPGWTFAVRGRESLYLAGRQSTAGYRATVDLIRQPAALRSRGVITTKGRKRAEHIYVLNRFAYLRESGGAWRRVPATGAVALAKVEDPLRAVETFRIHARQAGRMLTVRAEGDEVKLRLTVPRVRGARYAGKAFARSAQRELAPTLRKLRAAGVNTGRERILSALSETLTLDAKTYRIKAHRRSFGFAIPYGNGNILYRQEVEEKRTGPFRGTITLPRGVTA